MSARIEKLRDEPKSQVRYGLYNCGNLWSVHHLRREAIRSAEDVIGKPWTEVRSYMEIHKVRVEVYRP